MSPKHPQRRRGVRVAIKSGRPVALVDERSWAAIGKRGAGELLQPWRSLSFPAVDAGRQRAGGAPAMTIDARSPSWNIETRRALGPRDGY
jgi:hypothetical protein